MGTRFGIQLLVGTVFAIGLAALPACRSATSEGVTDSEPCVPAIPKKFQAWETQIGADRIKIENGNAYLWSGGAWQLVQALYDPDFFSKNYKAEPDCRIYRLDASTGSRFEVKRTLSESFEGVSSLRNLVGPERGWTGFTLQSPLAPTVPDYVALRTCLLNDTCTFRDNRLEPATDRAHGGSASFKATSVPPSAGMVTAKASLESTLMYFIKGDHVYFSGWFFVAQGKPFSLFDMESDWISESPGPRVILGEDNGLRVELKWADKPTYVQPAGSFRAFPSNAWVRVQVHYYLSEADDGIVQVWQNGELIIDAKGRTFPIPDAVMNSFEVGISANNHAGESSILYFDDLKLSNQAP